MSDGSIQSADDRRWFIASRWEEYEGEGRANLLRMVGITCFYCVELVNYYGLNLGVFEMPSVVSGTFHWAVSLITLAWAMMGLAVLQCRRQGIFPLWLKYLSTGADLLFLTSILTLADGPKSPLVNVYFLVIALAALRFSVRLIWFATGAAMAGYLFLLGFARWGEVPGWPKGDMIVPRHHQVMFLLSLLLTGVVLGQIIRRTRHLAESYGQPR